MPKNFIKLTGFLIFGLLIGCSSDGGEPTSQLIVVTANETNNDNATSGANTDIGSVTGVDTGSQTGDAGNTTTGVTTNGGSTDAGTDSTAGNTAAGTSTNGASTTTGGVTDGTATGVDTDGLDDGGLDATTGTVTSGATGGIGTTTDGTATATAGTTAGSNTDAGLDDAGLDTVGTAGTTAGTTAGSTTAGTGMTTAGTTGYPIGSLAYLIENNEQLSEALLVLQTQGFDQAINDAANVWTLFLPTNAALAAGAAFDIRAHIHVGSALSSDDLAGLSGRQIIMNDNQQHIIGGGVGTQPLTIANATITTEDLVGNTGLTVVHVIDAVIGEVEEPTSPYPAGSMEDVLFKRGDMTNVLSTFAANGLSLAFAQPFVGWTIFLPNDDALDDPADFRALPHIYNTALLNTDDLTGLTGSSIVMVGGNQVEISGGGVEPLTINGYSIIESNVRNANNNGSIVHIIDGVLP